MTVSSTTSRKSYAGDGLTTAFATTPVVFFDQVDLAVYTVITATGVATLKTLTTDYTVTGGSGLVGTVTMLVAPPVGTTLLIVRSLAITQQSDFVNNDASDAEVAEDAIDRLTMIAQELDTAIGRSFALADSDVSGASTTIPTPSALSLVGWNSLGTALQNFSSSVLSSALTTAFSQTLLAAVSAVASRIVLGFSAIAAKGDLFVGTAADTIGTQSVGTDGYVLQAQSGAAKGLQYLPPQAGFSLLNGYLDWTVAASALTVAIKTWAGTDPSATDPVYALVRSATATTGLPSLVKITAANSVVVSSGSTLGTRSAIASRVWAVLFDDAGTYRLGVINCLTTVAGAGAGSDVTAIYPLAGWGIASSTAEGGAGAADSAQTFYTGTAVASKPYAVLGYATFESGQATAGTWATAATRKQLWGPSVPLPGQRLQLAISESGAMTTGATAIPFDNTIPQNTEGDQYLSQAITPVSAANVLELEAVVMGSQSGANDVTGVALFQDTTANAIVGALGTQPLATGMQGTIVVRKRILAATSSLTTFKVRAGGTSGTFTFNGTAAAARYGGVLNSHLEVTEIMA